MNITFLKKNSTEEINYKSQIISKPGYGDFLVVKIPVVKNQFNVEIVDANCYHNSALRILTRTSL